MSTEEGLSDGCPDCGTPYGQRRRCYKCRGGGSPKAGETRKCGACGKDFYVPRWKSNDSARNQGVYCSRECKHMAQVLPPPAHQAAILGNGEIACARCGIAKPATEFGDDKRKRNGKKSWCRACCHLSVIEWRQRYPERYEAMKKLPRTELQKLRRRDLDLQQMYGLTLADFEQMLADQGGGCAICGTTKPNGPGSRFQVDHDHACCPRVGSCGECIRGLLCGSCNTLIGLAGEDPKRLMAAAAYLQRGSG